MISSLCNSKLAPSMPPSSNDTSFGPKSPSAAPPPMLETEANPFRSTESPAGAWVVQTPIQELETADVTDACRKVHEFMLEQSPLIPTKQHFPDVLTPSTEGRRSLKSRASDTGAVPAVCQLGKTTRQAWE